MKRKTFRDRRKREWVVEDNLAPGSRRTAASRRIEDSEYDNDSPLHFEGSRHWKQYDTQVIRKPRGMTKPIIPTYKNVVNFYHSEESYSDTVSGSSSSSTLQSSPNHASSNYRSQSNVSQVSSVSGYVDNYMRDSTKEVSDLGPSSRSQSFKYIRHSSSGYYTQSSSEFSSRNILGHQHSLRYVPEDKYLARAVSEQKYVKTVPEIRHLESKSVYRSSPNIALQSSLQNKSWVTSSTRSQISPRRDYLSVTRQREPEFETEIYLKPQKVIEIERLQKARPVNTQLTDSRNFKATSSSRSVGNLSSAQFSSRFQNAQQRSASERALQSTRNHDVLQGSGNKILWSKVHQKSEPEGKVLWSKIHQKDKALSTNFGNEPDITDSSGFMSGGSHLSGRTTSHLGTSGSAFSSSQQTISSQSSKTLTGHSQSSGSTKTLTGVIQSQSHPSELERIEESPAFKRLEETLMTERSRINGYSQSSTHLARSHHTDLVRKSCPVFPLTGSDPTPIQSQQSRAAATAAATTTTNKGKSFQEEFIQKRLGANYFQSRESLRNSTGSYDNLTIEDLVATTNFEQQIKKDSLTSAEEININIIGPEEDKFSKQEKQWLYKTEKKNEINEELNNQFKQTAIDEGYKSNNEQIASIKYSNDSSGIQNNQKYVEYSYTKETTSNESSYSKASSEKISQTESKTTGSESVYSEESIRSQKSSKQKLREDVDVGEIYKCLPSRDNLFRMCFKVSNFHGKSGQW